MSPHVLELSLPEKTPTFSGVEGQGVERTIAPTNGFLRRLFALVVFAFVFMFSITAFTAFGSLLKFFMDTFFLSY